MIARLKSFVDINRRSLPEDTDPAHEFQYLDIGAVGRGTLVGAPEVVTFGAAPSRARRLVKAGDTIVSTVRTYLRAVRPVDGMGEGLVVSTGFAVLSPHASLDSGYLGWLAQSDLVIEEVVARSVGVSYPAINASEIGEVRVPIPPLDCQRAIADFLDRETARIDSLIGKRQIVKERLEERFQAALHGMTSGGQQVTLRRLIHSVTSGPRGWSERVGQGSHPFVRSANLCRNSIEVRTDNLVSVDPPDLAEASRSSIHEGDVLIGVTGANTGWVGLAGAEVADGFVSQHVALIKPHAGMGEWIAYLLASPLAQSQLLGGQYGGTKQQLGLDDLRELTIHVPSPKDRREALEKFRTMDDRRRHAIRLVEQQLELLSERRRALVTAAVTGALDIPGVAA